MAESATVAIIDDDEAVLDSLRLLLTHAVDATLDRQVLLRRTSASEFRAACPSLPAGKWRIAVDDDLAGWSLRGRVDGVIAIELRARDPGGREAMSAPGGATS